MSQKQVKDLNDLLLAKGADAVRESLSKAVLLDAEVFMEPTKPTGKSTNGKQAPASEELVPQLVSMDTVETKLPEWLWKPLIPRGSVTLLQGNPGSRKTYIALAIATMLSRGSSFKVADGQEHETLESSPTLYLGGEDGLADTVKVRLDAMNADAKMIHVLTGWRAKEDREKKGHVTIKDYDGVLRKAIEQVKPALVVIDPLQSYLGDGVDLNKMAEVRPVLEKLGEIAQRYKIGVLLIQHLSKATQARAVHQGSGSMDFACFARSILLAGVDPETKKHAIVQTKCSNARTSPGIGFDVDALGVFEWTGESALTAADLLAPEVPKDKRTSFNSARDFLQDKLESGPVPSKEIEDAAREKGISHGTLQSAKKDLGLCSVQENDGGRRWLTMTQDQKVAYFASRGSRGPGQESESGPD